MGHRQPGSDDERLVLPAGCQTPAAIRRRGRARLTSWPAGRDARGADAVVATALDAAPAQHTALACALRTPVCSPVRVTRVAGSLPQGSP
ncbi:hypothetical protein [Streptomyces sp. NPDC051636]|uniref:hypothetical protein n=1 Tax=Streptomyces sp. NPDC051636 TaxID=3365663 RepID=UPI0037986C32